MTEERITENKMGTMPVGKLLLNMSWPAILSMLIQALYNIVDTIFVSFVGEQAIAAVTYIFPVSMLMISFSVGTGVGINSLIARRLGARRFDEADDAASHGFRLSFFNWAIFAIFGLFFATLFMKAFTETPYIIENGALYLKVTTIGSLFLMVQITNEKILQSTGNMIMPMICSLAGAVTNVILDPCFIFGLWIFPEMGVTGAAVATVIGQAVSMTLGLFLLFGHDHAVTIRFRGFKFKAEIIRDIYAVGLPAIIMQAIGSVMLFGLNAILGAISETGVAVLGVYQRLQSFVFMPVFGLTQGALPILGYNFGARNRERFMHAYKLALRVALIIMGLGFMLPAVSGSAAFDIQCHRSDVRDRQQGIKAYINLLPACSIRHYDLYCVSGDRSWYTELVEFTHKTAYRSASGSIHTQQVYRDYGSMDGISACRSNRDNLCNLRIYMALQERNQNNDIENQVSLP